MLNTGKTKSVAQVWAALLITLAMICAWNMFTEESAFAETSEDGWVYEDAGDGTLLITGYEGDEWDVVVPAQIGEKAVSGIKGGALAGKKGLYRITVSEGITSIGGNAFEDCPDLTVVILPDTVTSMGGKTFRYCYNLQECTLPQTLQEFPDRCFWECRNLKEIAIPEGVTTIPIGAFYNNWKLAKVTVPDSVSTIEKNAFHACLQLATIRLSEKVMTIDVDAFSDCAVLEIVAPKGSYADTFAQENGFGPEPMVMESPHPYPHENQQWEYTYPNPTNVAALQVTFSPKTYFSSVWDRLTITDGDNIKFVYYNDLLAGETLVLAGSSFTMSLRVLEDKEDCFGFRITDVEPMTPEEYQAYLDDLNAHPWLTHIVNGTLEITGYRGSERDVVIPEEINGLTVASIANYAFVDNNVLKTVKVEGNVRRIGDNAFRRCGNLEEIILPNSVTEIGYYAFGDCPKLKKITLPKELTTLGDGAFEDCGALEELTLPEGLTALKFGLCNGCKSLSAVSLPDSLKEIEEYVFKECKALEELALPEGLEVIRRSTFVDSGLTAVVIPSTVHTIGVYLFSQCPNLTELTVDSDNPYYAAQDNIIYDKSGEQLVSIAGGLSGVITVPDGVKEICEGAFAYDGKITKVILPNSVTNMGDVVFNECNNLEEVVLSESLTVLPLYTFYGCSSLKEVRLPSSMTEIKEYAFSTCEKLERLYIPDSVTSMEEDIFSESENVVIYASEGSTAFQYAKEYGLKVLGAEAWVEEDINALPDQITMEDKAAVDAAVEEWLELKESEKARVSASAKEKLAAAEDVIYQTIAKARSTKIKSAKRKKGTKALVTWTKSQGASGYKVRYSTSKSFKKGVKTKKASASATKITLKKLKKGKKYYVQVIPYTNVKNRVTGVKTVIDGKQSGTKKM